MQMPDPHNDIKRIAFVVASLTGEDLKSPSRDAALIYEILTDTKLGMCDAASSSLVYKCNNRAEFQSEFLKVLKKWNSNNQLILYFSGHGEVKKGKQYCILMGTEPIPFANIISDLQMEGVSRAILILDACRSGAALGGVKNNEFTPFEQKDIPQGIAIIASSKESQLSYELEDGSRSVFTHIFCEGIKTGLSGKTTPNDLICVGDIVDYIKKQLDTNSKYESYIQRPVFDIDKSDNDIWIARNISTKDDVQTRQIESNNITSYDDLKILYEQNTNGYHPCIIAKVDDLDLELIKQLSDAIIPNLYHGNNLEEVLDKLHLYSPILHNNKKYVHRSAVLCFHQQPQLIYGQARSIFVVGSPGDSYFRREDIHGGLSHQIHLLIQKVEKETNKISFIDNDGTRKELQDIDLSVARELISNAITHRDYEVNGTVKVTITKEALEIQSPGYFPKDVSWDQLIDQISSSVSAPVDTAISFYLTNLLMYEGIGRGFSIFRKYIEENGSDSLTCKETLNTVSVRLLRRGQVSSSNLALGLEECRNSNAVTLTPNNLPRSGVVKYVGRSRDLGQIHTFLQQKNRIVITAITGMGGIGKTEMALQYAINQLQQGYYPAGVCWLRARNREIATDIVTFAQVHLGLSLPDQMEIDDQVRFCWQRWPEGEALVILDDVTDYQSIVPYLPPSDPRFKMLITTRLDLGSTVQKIDIEELDEDSSIALLESLVGVERVQSQLDEALALCMWVGYLPLALELFGRFLARKVDWSFKKLLKALENKRLETQALIIPEVGMTGQLGITAALELSWQELNEQEQELACLLGMFAIAPIPWSLVESCQINVDPEYLEEIRDKGLMDRSLLKRVVEGNYQLHQIVQEYFRIKLHQSNDRSQSIKNKFCRVMVGIAKTIDDTPTISQIGQFREAFAHLEEGIRSWVDSFTNEDLIWPFVGIGRFYVGQGNYAFAEPWYRDCVKVAKERLGLEHPDVATSLNNLAGLYYSQGRYDEAEPLYRSALEMYERLLGEEHSLVATSLNNLAGLYSLQGKYEEAEPLFRSALEMYKRLLGEEHPSVATSLNNLAELYSLQGKYEEAEPLFRSALEMLKRMLGEEHPDVATSLNNLASLYESEGKYEEAEPLYCSALEMRVRLLGMEHPDVATSLNNLALLYSAQRKYEEAEPLYHSALEMRIRLLGMEHPDIATSLNNLAGLYELQGKYEEAETLYLSALEMYKRLLGMEYPDVATSLNNLARLYELQGKYEEAEPFYLSALDMYTRLFGDEHPSVLMSLNNLAKLYLIQGRVEEVQILFHSVLETKIHLSKGKDSAVVKTMSNLDALIDLANNPDDKLQVDLRAQLKKLLDQDVELSKSIKPILQADNPDNSTPNIKQNITGDNNQVIGIVSGGNVFGNITGTVIIGQPANPAPPIPTTAPTSIKTILVLAANPKGTDPLRLGEEMREIQTGLERSQHLDRFRIEQRWAVTPTDIRRALLDCQPQIVHFSGHGVGVETPGDSSQSAWKLAVVSEDMASLEGLMFEDATGSPQLMSSRAIANLFSLFADQIECVMLNACYSVTQADAIAQHIPYVVGIDRSIGDRAATEFAIGFYDALLAGRSVDFAYKLGCSAIQMVGIPEHLTPVLKRNIQAV
jgi:tetratricopeptide (TPR) repeat protein